MKKIFRLLVTVLLMVILGCSSGGDTSGGDSSVAINDVPSISNLSLSQTIIPMGNSTIQGTFDFADNGKNIASFTLVGADGSQQTTNISSASGINAGQITGTVQLTVTSLGRQDFSIYVTDSKGLQSNILTGSINVTPSEVFAVGTIDGGIYLVGSGGEMGTNAQRTVFYFGKYDPLNGEWTKKSQMATVLYDAGFGVIGTRLYIIGEYITDIYDQVNDQWLVGTRMSSPRSNVSACSFDGKLYIFGGKNTEPSNIVEQYDPTLNLWTTKASMPTARTNVLALAANNKIYVIGGWISVNSELRTTAVVEEYDPKNDTWTTKASFPKGSMYGQTASVVNDKIYRFDSNKIVQEYNSLNDTWTEKGNMPVASNSMGSAAVDNKIYVIGSMGIYEYDPTSDKWTQMP